MKRSSMASSCRLQIAFRTVCVVAGTIGTGCLAGAEVQQDGNRQTQWPWWYRWLALKPSDVCESSSSASLMPCFTTGSLGKREGGYVLAWGSVFGRRPERIEFLGNDVICAVAGANGMGAAVDENGCGRVFARDAKKYKEVPREMVHGKVLTSVAWREAHNQALFVDIDGGLHLATVKVIDVSESGQVNKGVEVDSIESLRLSEGVGHGLLSRIINRSKRATKVSCGDSRCVALCHDGSVYSLQDNDQGLVSISQIHSAGASSTMVDASCSDGHILSLDCHGTLYSMGEDRWIQLGRDATPWIKKTIKEDLSPSESSLRKAPLFEGLVGGAVAAGGNHSVLLVVDGTLFTCGFNQFGQLGHHNYSTLAPPSPISDVALCVGAVVAGENHTCVVSVPSGVLRCAGANESGQLGNGALQPSFAWRKVKYNGLTIKPQYVYAGRSTTVVVVKTD